MNELLTLYTLLQYQCNDSVQIWYLFFQKLAKSGIGLSDIVPFNKKYYTLEMSFRDKNHVKNSQEVENKSKNQTKQTVAS